jgi:hypothetical protein
MDSNEKRELCALAAGFEQWRPVRRLVTILTELPGSLIQRNFRGHIFEQNVHRADTGLQEDGRTDDTACGSYILRRLATNKSLLAVTT